MMRGLVGYIIAGVLLSWIAISGLAYWRGFHTGTTTEQARTMQQAKGALADQLHRLNQQLVDVKRFSKHYRQTAAKREISNARTTEQLKAMLSKLVATHICLSVAVPTGVMQQLSHARKRANAAATGTIDATVQPAEATTGQGKSE